MLVCIFLFLLQVPKSVEQVAHNTTEACVDTSGAMKQVSYKTEIIAGVPITTTTQVTKPHDTLTYIKGGKTKPCKIHRAVP